MDLLVRRGFVTRVGAVEGEQAQLKYLQFTVAWAEEEEETPSDEQEEPSSSAGPCEEPCSSGASSSKQGEQMSSPGAAGSSEKFAANFWLHQYDYEQAHLKGCTDHTMWK